MKKIAKLITFVTLFALILSSLIITPASAANTPDDWQIVTCAGKSEADVSNGLIEQTERNGIRLVQGGHYPEDNAGLLYAKPQDLSAGIQLDVTIEETDTGSPDMWYGLFLLNRPLYFNTTAKSADDGYGIVLLARTSALQWFEISPSGFGLAASTTISNTEDFFAPGANVVFDIKLEDEELHIYVNNNVVEQGGKPYNFKNTLPYLQDQCYIGFSMSETYGSRQSFVLNGINGETAITEGVLPTRIIGGEAEEPIDFDHVQSFTLADFSNADYFKRISNSIDCDIEMADEGGIKVTVTGPNPYFSLPMSRSRWFDGVDFYLLKMVYKTAETVDMEFRFTMEEVPNEDYCIVEYELAASDDFTEVTVDMDEDNQGHWSTGEVRSLAIRPMAPGAGEAGKVFYFKSISIEKEPVPDVTEPPATQAPETQAPEPVDTKAPDTEPAGTEKPAEGNTEPSVITPNPEKPNLTWLWIVIGVVAAAAIVCVIVVLGKKKKQ